MYFALIYIQLNSVMTCYACAQLIRFIYIFICICFVPNKVRLCLSMYAFNQISGAQAECVAGGL